MINWSELLGAVAVMCVLEGALPFINPAALRRLLLRVTELDDRELRMGGLFSMLVGVAVLYMVRT